MPREAYPAIVCVLSVFNIELALGEDGNPRMPKIEFDGASVRYVFLEPSIHAAVDASCHVRDPNPFERVVKPRSEGARKLVRETRDRVNY